MPARGRGLGVGPPAAPEEPLPRLLSTVKLLLGRITAFNWKQFCSVERLSTVKLVLEVLVVLVGLITAIRALLAGLRK